ncbi:MAG: cytochrome c [Silicimonas sp.]|nr:cytochrome c [Silicimonas sp.]
MTFKLKGYLAAGMLLAIAGTAQAQETTFGKASFDRNCAVCHGANGAGDGIVAELFEQRPRNLRSLAKDNNGVFPFSEVYQAINGRRDIRGHGSSEMPIWGDLFSEEALPMTFHPGVSAEELVQGRILSLVYYLQSIQE